MQHAPKKDLWENPAYMYALLYCAAMNKGVNISVMMPYADGLLNMAEWYAQLWAESLGKRYGNDGSIVNKGQTPVRALGVTDQHSRYSFIRKARLTKLFPLSTWKIFIRKLKIPQAPIDMLDAAYLQGQTVNKLIASEMRATEYAVTQAGKMNMRITLAGNERKGDRRTVLLP